MIPVSCRERSLAVNSSRIPMREVSIVNTSMKWALLSLLALPFSWTGCAQCPCKSSDAKPTDQSRDVLDFLTLSKEFWRIESSIPSADVGPRRPGDVVRLAIAEFTVEYVGEDADVGTGLKLALPDVLYDALVSLLPDLSRDAVAVETVTQAASYARLNGMEATDPVFLKGSPALRYPTTSLRTLDDEQADRDEVLAELLEEVEADSVALVRLRVGIRGGRASVEPGSELHFVKRGGKATLTSRMAAVSPLPAVGETGAVNSSLFAKGVSSLFRPCISMAIVASEQR